MKKGFIHIYTGNGKGKTTAAIGLALRAAGAGLKVFIGQFLKNGSFGEIKAMAKLKGRITVKQYGRKGIIKDKPHKEDINKALQGFKAFEIILKSGKYDLVIMDEVNVALDLRLLSFKQIQDLIKIKPPHVDLVMTGRNAHPALIKAADLVTEMKEIKHYYKKGVKARPGFEK